MLFIIASKTPTSISGAFIILIVAIAAAVPLVVRQYFKGKRQDSKYGYKNESKRLVYDAKNEGARIEVTKIQTKQDHQTEMYKLKSEERREKAKAKAEAAKTKAIFSDPNNPTGIKKAVKDIGKLTSLVGVGVAAPMIIAKQEEEDAKWNKDSIDLDLFRKKAMALGCSADMSLTEMAETVIKYAPEVSLAQLPESMPLEEKAARLVGAYVVGGNAKEKRQDLENKQKEFEQRLALEKKEAEHRMRMEEKALKGKIDISKKTINADVQKEAINATAKVASEVGTTAVESYIDNTAGTVNKALDMLPGSQGG